MSNFITEVFPWSGGLRSLFPKKVSLTALTQDLIVRNAHFKYRFYSHTHTILRGDDEEGTTQGIVICTNLPDIKYISFKKSMYLPRHTSIAWWAPETPPESEHITFDNLYDSQTNAIDSETSYIGLFSITERINHYNIDKIPQKNIIGDILTIKHLYLESKPIWMFRALLNDYAKFILQKRGVDPDIASIVGGL